MKIAILTSYFFHEVKEIQGQDRVVWGGAERYLVELCHLLQSENHEVTVFQSLPQTVSNERGQQVHINCSQITKEYANIPIVCLPDTDNAWSYSTNPRLNMVFNEISIFADLRIYFATFMCFPYVVNPAISISHGIFWDYPQHAVHSSKKEDKEEFFRRQLYGLPFQIYA